MFIWFRIRAASDGALDLFQRLHAYLLDNGLPDLIRHPCRSALRLLYLLPLTSEYVNFLCSPFSQPDIGIASVRSLESSLPGRFPCEDTNFVAFFVSDYGVVSFGVMVDIRRGHAPLLAAGCAV
jgi:hypothetical protein